MSKKPLVSVVMNCLNGERYLKQSIKSIVNQTYKNWELIFWDNASKDNSKNIFKKFKDKRLKYFYFKKKIPLYSSRNFALKKCKGKFIAFLDQDDLWSIDKLEKQIPLFKNSKVGLVYSNFWKYNQKKLFSKRLAIKESLPKGEITNNLLKKYVTGLITIVIRKKLIEKTKKVFDPQYNMLADFKFILNFSTKCEFDCIQEPLATYRYHPNQMSKKLFSTSVEQHLKWINSKSEVKKFKKYKEFKYLVNRVIFMQIAELLDRNLKIQAIKKILEYPTNIYKIKLVLKLIMPKSIFSFLFGEIY